MLPRLTIPELPQAALQVAKGGLAMMLYGGPGVGKTSALQALGEDPEVVEYASGHCGHPIQGPLPVVTLSAPELNVEDLMGVPTVVELMRQRPGGLPEAVRITRWALPEALDPTHPFILFVDEPNRCESSVRNALFQLITGRTTTAGFAMPPGSLVVMAGNRMEDRAGVRSLDTAFNNRCAHFELMVSPEAWQDWAGLQPDLDRRVRAFLARHPDFLCAFEADSPHPAQPTPRSWAALGRALQFCPGPLEARMAQAHVGGNHAQLFMAFCNRSMFIPSLEELQFQADRIDLPGPDDLDSAWMLASVLADFIRSDGLSESEEISRSIGHGVGVVLGRMARGGLEEISTFTLHRAYQSWKMQARGNPKIPMGLRYLCALETVAKTQEVQDFLVALEGVGA